MSSNVAGWNLNDGPMYVLSSAVLRFFHDQSKRKENYPRPSSLNRQHFELEGWLENWIFRPIVRLTNCLEQMAFRLFCCLPNLCTCINVRLTDGLARINFFPTTLCRHRDSNLSRVALTRDLLKDTLPTELTTLRHLSGLLITLANNLSTATLLPHCFEALHKSGIA